MKGNEPSVESMMAKRLEVRINKKGEKKKEKKRYRPTGTIKRGDES